MPSFWGLGFRVQSLGIYEPLDLNSLDCLRVLGCSQPKPYSLYAVGHANAEVIRGFRL